MEKKYIEYLKKMEKKRKKGRKKIKKFTDFKRSGNPSDKPFEFTSVASSPIPGPLSVVTPPANIS